MTAEEVTCVIPHGGTAKYLPEVIASAAAQEFAEILVVNDGMPPGQLSGIEPVATVRIVHLPRSLGAANARNVGIRSCKTPNVVLLDHDDLLGPGYLEAMFRYLETQGLRCAGGTLRYIGENARRVGARVSRRWDFCLCSGFLADVGLFEEAGFFPDSISEDHLFFDRVEKLTRVTTCPDAMVLYRIHGQSESSTNAKSWWAFGKLMDLYNDGRLSLEQANRIAREFAASGAVPAGLEDRLEGSQSAEVSLTGRLAYASWLNRDFAGMVRHGARLLPHSINIGRLAFRKWTFGPGSAAQGQ